MKQIFTPKDAAIILRDTPIDIRSTREDDIHTIYATAMMMAIEVLEDVDKYRWHDLRKEPDELPAECTPVLVTWVNHNPVSYYSDIKDKPFSDAMGVYCEGKWWWWSSACIDYLQEYGESRESDKIDKCVEIIAWRYIEPFGGEDDGNL